MNIYRPWLKEKSGLRINEMLEFEIWWSFGKRISPITSGIWVVWLKSLWDEILECDLPRWRLPTRNYTVPLSSCVYWMARTDTYHDWQTCGLWRLRGRCRVLILCVPTENISRTLERRCNKFACTWHSLFWISTLNFAVLSFVAELVREGRDGASIS